MARRLAVLLYWKLRQARKVPLPVRTPGSPTRTLVDDKSIDAHDWAPGLPARGGEIEERIMVG